MCGCGCGKIFKRRHTWSAGVCIVKNYCAQSVRVCQNWLHTNTLGIFDDCASATSFDSSNNIISIRPEFRIPKNCVIKEIIHYVLSEFFKLFCYEVILLLKFISDKCLLLCKGSFNSKELGKRIIAQYCNKKISANLEGCLD